MAVFPGWDPQKAGPGVRPDAPRKTGAARWFEVTGRDLDALWLALPLTNLWLPAALLPGPIYTPREKTFDLEASIRALHERQE